MGKTFEYCYLSFDNIYSSIDEMNELGKRGWELCSLTKMQIDDDPCHYYLLITFKRIVRINYIENLCNILFVRRMFRRCT